MFASPLACECGSWWSWWSWFASVRIRHCRTLVGHQTNDLIWEWLSINFYCHIKQMVEQGCPNDPFDNQMMKTDFESHKQNQTNKWWQSAGFLFRTQIGLPLLTIEFLLVRSPKGALQRWRLGWSDKLTGFPRDETLFAVVFLLSKLFFYLHPIDIKENSLAWFSFVLGFIEIK